MSITRTLFLSSLLGLASPAWSATPADGALTVDSRELAWSGDGPYVFTNLTPQLGAADLPPVCEEVQPVGCDVFTLNVDISDEFRDDEDNKRETVRVGITFPQDPGGQVDYDLYIYDSAGTEVGRSADSAPQTSETVSFALKSLKNGAYSVKVIIFTPLGTDYEGFAMIGNKPAAAAPALSISPQIGTAPLAVSFDAGGLQSSGDCSFDFGDGSEPAAAGTAQAGHVYPNAGNYLARVSCGDASGVKAATAAQTVVVLPEGALDEKGTLFGGAFGLGGLLGLLGACIAGRRRGRGTLRA